jgi:hypothetical protein
MLAAEVALSAARAGIAYVGSNAHNGFRRALVGSLFWDW